MDTKTEWYMTKFRLLKHRGCNLIGHRLSCKNSCHRSLDTRRQCDLPSKSMYHCRLSQTLMRKIWCLMFDETIYKVPKKSFCIKIEVNCFESDICMVSHDYFFIFFRDTHFCKEYCTKNWRQRPGNRKDEFPSLNKYWSPSITTLFHSYTFIATAVTNRGEIMTFKQSISCWPELQIFL